MWKNITETLHAFVPNISFSKTTLCIFLTSPQATFKPSFSPQGIIKPLRLNNKITTLMCGGGRSLMREAIPK